jgi:hypothetical protein
MVNNVPAALINDLVRVVWEVLILSIAYGLISMAAIQFLKDIFYREWFNRRAFYRWFDDMQGTPRALEQMIWLAAAGDKQALFSLTIDKMAGQIGVAANTVLEAPKQYSELLSVLAFSKGFEATFGTDDKDRRTDFRSAFSDDASQAADISLLVSTDLEKLSIDLPDSRALRIQYADARTRVGHRVQRQIDLLQLRTTQRWMKFNQLLSLMIALYIGCIPVLAKNWLAQHYGFFRLASILPMSIALSLLGGWFAPILRDLVAHQSKAE